MSNSDHRATSNRATGGSGPAAGPAQPQPGVRTAQATRAGLFRVDFYDRDDPRLRYLGRLTRSSPRDRWQIRLIGRAELRRIFSDNRTASRATLPSDMAVNFPGNELVEELFPAAAGLHAPGSFDHERIERQSVARGLILRVTPNHLQKQHLARMLSAAKRTDVEQGAYIVLHERNRTARLYLLTARPVATSSKDFTFCLVERQIDGQRVYFPCDNNGRPTAAHGRVIGTVHTHYLRRKAAIDARRGRLGTNVHMGGRRVVSIKPEVSKDDRESARNRRMVVYAIEGKKRHKAMPDGTAVNDLTTKFNLLVDALESFAGKRPPISGRPVR